MSNHKEDDDFEIVRGSGNVWRDLILPNADLEQLRAILAAQIIGVMKDQGLNNTEMAARTGFNKGDFSRIRRVKLERFTVDRLMMMLEKLDKSINISITVTDRPDSGCALAHV